MFVIVSAIFATRLQKLAIRQRAYDLEIMSHFVTFLIPARILRGCRNTNQTDPNKKRLEPRLGIKLVALSFKTCNNRILDLTCATAHNSRHVYLIMYPRSMWSGFFSNFSRAHGVLKNRVEHIFYNRSEIMQHLPRYLRTFPRVFMHHCTMSYGKCSC